jgi:hypothetical protein
MKLGFEGVLDEVLSVYNASFSHLRLIWRSQFPGVCGPFLASGGDFVGRWVGFNLTKRHNYHLFPQWDDYASAVVSEFWDLSPLYSRLDAHVGSDNESKYPADCLHFCQQVLYDLVAPSFLGMIVEK